MDVGNIMVVEIHCETLHLFLDIVALETKRSICYIISTPDKMLKREKQNRDLISDLPASSQWASFISRRARIELREC